MQYIIYCNERKFNKNHQLSITEFIKRLSPYCTITFNVGVNPHITNDLNKMGHHCIILTINPSTYSSVDFSKYIENLQINGYSTIHVFIGFQEISIRNILTDSIPENDFFSKVDIMSLSQSSLSNQTSAVLFLEQIYRGYTIIQGKTYHK